MNTVDMTSTRQYLTFTLDNEIFGLNVAKVREVLDYMTITTLPKAPEFLRGVVNVRGTVLPVVDLRLKFGLSKTERTINTCIVLTEVSLNDEVLVIGALADSVREVIELETDRIEAAPRLGTRWRTEFIDGIGKHNEQFVILLDIDRVFSADEVLRLQEDVPLGANELHGQPSHAEGAAR